MNNSYHSILIEITPQQGGGSHDDLAQDYLNKLDLPAKTNFIFLNKEGESFKIAQVRELKIQAQYGKSVDEPMVFIICHAEKITEPAQNALLKLLEEPPANTMLVLVANQGHRLLETIISRCRIDTGLSTKYSVLSTNSTSADLPEVSLLLSFFRDPATTSYSDLIDLSEKLKDREIAIKTIQAVLKKTHSDLSKQSRAVLSTSALSTALDSLKKNGNVRLVLEDCFFMFKRGVK